MKEPKFINEWMSELLANINKDDPASSQICAFVGGIFMHCQVDQIKQISLSWQEFASCFDPSPKPNIEITFK